MGTLIRRIVHLMVAATVADSLVLALAISAHAGTITMCLNKQGKIKSVNTTCKPNQLTLSWDSDGVAGPPGPPGAPGPAGANGTNIQVLTGGTLGSDTGYAIGILPGQNPFVYLGPGNGGSITSNHVAVPVTAGTLSNLLVSAGVYPPDCASATCNYQFTLCVNGNCPTTPSLSCTTLGVTDETQCSDTSDVVSVNDGDLISIKAEATDGTTAPADVTFSVEHTSTPTTP
jgi:hypothetical protein